MGGSRRDVAAVVVALAAAAVMLAVSELPRCHGELPKKPHYLCGDINKGGMFCNVELKVNEILKVDCSKAMNLHMPGTLFFRINHSVCTPDNPLNEFDIMCKMEDWTTANAGGVVEWTKGAENKPDEEWVFTLKNKNKTPPVDMKRIAFGCNGGDKAWAIFNVTFSKEINNATEPDKPIVPWSDSGSWGLMSAQRLVFASAMMTIALAVGLSV